MSKQLLTAWTQILSSRLALYSDVALNGGWRNYLSNCCAMSSENNKFENVGGKSEFIASITLLTDRK